MAFLSDRGSLSSAQRTGTDNLWSLPVMPEGAHETGGRKKRDAMRWGKGPDATLSRAYCRGTIPSRDRWRPLGPAGHQLERPERAGASRVRAIASVGSRARQAGDGPSWSDSAAVQRSEKAVGVSMREGEKVSREEEAAEGRRRTPTWLASVQGHTRAHESQDGHRGDKHPVCERKREKVYKVEKDRI